LEVGGGDEGDDGGDEHEDERGGAHEEGALLAAGLHVEVRDDAEHGGGGQVVEPGGSRGPARGGQKLHHLDW